MSPMRNGKLEAKTAQEGSSIVCSVIQYVHNQISDKGDATLHSMFSLSPCSVLAAVMYTCLGACLLALYVLFLLN
jgi:hypothetical protein